MLSVVKFVPVLKALPPVKAPYHEIVPPPQPLAVMLTGTDVTPVTQLLPLPIGALGIALTTPVPVATLTVAAPVDVAETLPEAPFVASLFNLT
jgi:hypothetical protein